MALPMLVGGLSRNVNDSPRSRSSLALAPMLMGALGKVKRDRHLDQEGVAQLVESERLDLERATPQAREGDLRRLAEEASGSEDVASWADRLGSALGGSLTGRSEEPPG